ncbi:MAG: hypothetical protein E7261_03825 [Lachnospiraceae bacterium]|nr:hypothetical protein [Lachnospiraceae bacterium]
MKKKGRLIFWIIISCCFFFFVYYVTYTYTYNDLQNNKLYDEDQLIPKTTEEITPAIMQQKKLPVTTDNKRELIVTAKTVYILEKHNKTTGDFTREILPIPIELLGLDHNKIQKYTLAKSAEEENENKRLELVTFDNGLLVLRQTFEYEEPEYMFYLVAEWGKVVVYKYYEESLYTKTNIKIVDLPGDLQEKIKKGIPVENERELFMFLESYSS